MLPSGNVERKHTRIILRMKHEINVHGWVFIIHIFSMKAISLYFWWELLVAFYSYFKFLCSVWVNAVVSVCSPPSPLPIINKRRPRDHLLFIVVNKTLVRRHFVHCKITKTCNVARNKILHDAILWKRFASNWLILRGFIGHRYIPTTRTCYSGLWCFRWC